MFIRSLINESVVAMKAILPALLVMCFFALIFCNRNKFEKDISDIDLEIDIKRLEKDIFTFDFDSIDQKLPYLRDKYGAFFEIYNQNIIHIGKSTGEQYPEDLMAFITDFTVNQAYKNVTEQYEEITDIKKGLQKAFKYYKYYFPDKMVPAIYTYVSGFNQSIVVTDRVLAIGLDKYLGQESDVYKNLMVKKYLRKTMERKYIVPDCMKAWALTEWVFNDSVNNVINNMIYHGKILYFKKAMMPEVTDSILLGFSPREMEWCKQQEQMMWKYLIDNDLLFERDYMVINKLVNPAPYTGFFSQQSPGMAAVWIGWQIVKQYMNRNDDKSLKQLMENNNYEEILREAKYKP